MLIGVIDVETTGLDPQEDLLLELALLVYRTKQEEHTTGPQTGVHAAGLIMVEHAIFHLESSAGLCPEVREMHTKNYLLEDCRASTLVPSDYDAWLAKQLEPYRQLVPVGRNVDFDLGFIKRHLPETAKRFHYRKLDLTTVDYLFGRRPRPASTHRALQDATSELLELLPHMDKLP